MRLASRETNALNKEMMDVDESRTIDEVLFRAHLDYTVALQELSSQVITPDGVSTVGYKHLGVVRMDTLQSLGVVGQRYTVIQNRDAFAPLQYLKDEGFIEAFEQAGSINNGERAFVIARLASGMDLGDPHRARLLFSTSHDGSGSYSVRAIAERLHCKNQIPRLSKMGRRIAAIKHTQSATYRVQQVRARVMDEIRWFDEYSLNYELMMQSPVGPHRISEFVKVLAPDLPKDATPRQVNAQETKRMQIAGRINGPTNDNIRGTVAALFQGAVEYSDYDSRGNNAERILLGRDVEFKARAWDAALALL